MKHRRHIVEAQQGGLTGGWLRKVRDVDDNGLRSQQAALIDETVLPRTAVLVRTLKVISVKERQGFSVRVEDFKDAHVRLIDRQIFSFLEGNSVEFVRRKEYAVVKHVLEFEIRLYLRIIQIVFSLANFLGIVFPVSWAKCKSALLCVDQFLHARGFVASFRRGRGHNSGQQLLSRLWRLGHLIVERESRVIRIAQKLCPLRA